MDAQRFANEWVEAWNRRDVEAVLAHFAEDVRFVSPKAEAIVGHGVIDGKPALRDYWRRALERIGTLRFELLHTAWDEGARTLAMIYVGTLGDKRVRACEVLRFGEDGLARHGEGFYGASA